MSDNYYEILGVSKDASASEIKKAYRSASLNCHPDRTNDPVLHAKSVKLNEAYAVLSDTEEREKYDNKLSMGLGPNDDLPPFFGMGGFPHGMGGMGGMPPGIRIFTTGGPMGGMGGMNGLPPDLDAIFSMLGGGGMGFFPQPRMMKPKPIVVNVTISMDIVINGGVIEVEYDRIIFEKNMNIQEKNKLNVNVPQGIDENEVIIITGQGNMINDEYKTTGEVHVVVHIANNTEFERRGLDLIYKVKITLKESLCGFKIKINHPSGKIYSLSGSIGKVVSPGFTKVMNNAGLQKNETKGNLILIFDVIFPEKLEESQIKALENIL